VKGENSVKIFGRDLVEAHGGFAIAPEKLY
jgi:hypothetical protein